MECNHMVKDKKRSFFSWLECSRQDNDANNLKAGQNNVIFSIRTLASGTSFSSPFSDTGRKKVQRAAQMVFTPSERSGRENPPPAQISNASLSKNDHDAIFTGKDHITAPLKNQQDAEKSLAPESATLFVHFKKNLVKIRKNLGSGFIRLFRGKKIDDNLFGGLENHLLIADVGVETTRKIIDGLTSHVDCHHLKDAEALYSKLREEMASILTPVDRPLIVTDETPFVILIVGANGVGKTTTIGKLARQYQAEGKSVMLAAGDTFRAAAVEQLLVWGEYNHIPVVSQHTGADSASVIFDAIQAAKARSIDVLIADTSGRLQNKVNLMEELKKIVRVMKKLDANAPHEIMLILDASTGQNAVSQSNLFNNAVGLTGIALTKLDGTAKGGVIFTIADRFNIPIRYIGIGEGIEDLQPFKAGDFIEALLPERIEEVSDLN